MSGARCVYAQVVHATLYTKFKFFKRLSLSSCKVLLAVATYIYDAYTHIYIHI